MPDVECGFRHLPESNTPEALVHLGPTLMVRIGFDPNFRPVPGAAPELPSDRHPALVDTGATECCIDSELAVALNLPIFDRQQMASAHGVGAVDMHLAQIHVPELGVTVYGPFAGVHLRAGELHHTALIGRTFLRRFTMVYEGETGAVSIGS